MKLSKNYVYCAFCKEPRKIYAKSHVGIREMILSLIGSACLSMAIWQEFNPISLIFFPMGLIVSEIGMRIKWRMKMTCKHCGFDPVSYRKSPMLAVNKVQEFIKKRESDPLSSLRPLPQSLKSPRKKTLDPFI